MNDSNLEQLTQLLVSAYLLYTILVSAIFLLSNEVSHSVKEIFVKILNIFIQITRLVVIKVRSESFRLVIERRHDIIML